VYEEVLRAAPLAVERMIADAATKGTTHEACGGVRRQGTGGWGAARSPDGLVRVQCPQMQPLNGGPMMDGTPQPHPSPDEDFEARAERLREALGVNAILRAQARKLSPPPPPRFNIGGLLLACAGAAGMTLSITVLFKGMALIMMTEGGFVASGGPYEIAHPAPEWIWILPVSILALFVFGGISMFVSSRKWGINLIFFAWIALFLSLGWNFWRFGLTSPFDGGLEWGWIVCGAVFWLMGLAPALFAVDLARMRFRDLAGGPAGNEESLSPDLRRARRSGIAYVVGQGLSALGGVLLGVLAFAAAVD